MLRPELFHSVCGRNRANSFHKFGTESTPYGEPIPLPSIAPGATAMSSTGWPIVAQAGCLGTGTCGRICKGKMSDPEAMLPALMCLQVSMKHKGGGPGNVCWGEKKMQYTEGMFKSV